jgi:hypothetical protein
LKNLQIEESPGETTAGLTSANQLVNMTDAVSFDPSNTSSAIPEPLLNIPQFSKSPGRVSPKDNFREVLRRSVRRGDKVLDILAKF